MDLLLNIRESFADDRLLANLIGVHAVLGAVLITSFIVRKILLHGGDQLGRWTGIHWLEHVGKEANRRIRTLLFWITLSSLTGAIVLGVVYHAAGRDLRVDVLDWYAHLTAQQLVSLGLTAGKLILLALGVRLLFGLVRRAKHRLEDYTLHLLHLTTTGETHGAQSTPAAGEKSPVDLLPLDRQPSAEEAAERDYQEQTVRHWFFLLERFALATVFLGGLWSAGHVLAWSALDAAVAFAMYLLAVIMVARLATLACKTILHALAKVGDRNLETSYVRLYWERVTRLFPFGQKCFEAAVYVYAASLCVDAFDKTPQVEKFGQRIVSCIAIFFITRVLIELLQVLINEAFGMHDEEQVVDQKRQTLVPLLQSVSQYVIYFGSIVTMLRVFDVETGPILAGAGIIGLAGGLGAQSLVTDLVSGFFILFENQYLVGDVVQIGDAQGRVEAVSIRTTHVRDDSGKLHIIPNGQVKNVVNFSKGYVNAVVDFKVPTSTSLEQVMRDLAEAGRRLRQQRREVLGETVVKGLVDLTPSDMVIRSVTKVQPGTHIAMQAEFRRHLKQIYDERQARAA